MINAIRTIKKILKKQIYIYILMIFIAMEILKVCKFNFLIVNILRIQKVFISILLIFFKLILSIISSTSIIKFLRISENIEFFRIYFCLFFLLSV